MHDNDLPAIQADSRLSRGVVVAIADEGLTVMVRAGTVVRACDVLQQSEMPLILAPDDSVFVWQPQERDGRGIVVGRIGPSHLPEPDDTIPDEIVIEAAHALTLKVGDGSITIREDGRILIKGKDLVSHAKRMNRIRGGSVQIN